MATGVYDFPWMSPPNNYLHGCFELSEQVTETSQKVSTFLQVPPPSTMQKNIPDPPPPPPGLSLSKRSRSSCEKSSHQCCCSIPKEARDLWDKLFKSGYGADVCILTQDQQSFPAHSIVLSVASPILRKCLQNSKLQNGVRYLSIPGVPHGAVSTFVRFLYSSCYEEEDMKKFVLHLLVLSHCYVVPSLKRLCMQYLENCWLNTENVIDVLQLANKCDAPRLCFVCVRMVVKNFRTVASTEGWKLMKRVNPALEQQLLEALVEADSRKQEKTRRMEERKIYLQLLEAIEALNHICKDGCSTIGPRDKTLKGSQVSCGFPACKGVEMLVRHFFSCKARVPGGCVQCKRMWQLLELHSRICTHPECCNVPLCRHFKEKMRQQSKKDEAKWKLLVRKVVEAKKRMNPFAAPYSCSSCPP